MDGFSFGNINGANEFPQPGNTGTSESGRNITGGSGDFRIEELGGAGDPWYANFLETIGWILLIIVVFYVVRWIIRIIYEVWSSKNLVYIQVTLPRKDSKLDKEKETKKDFKEKIGVMSVVYKAVHKMAETSFKLTILDFFFNHIKVSFEIAHKEGQICFYVVTYKNLLSFLSRQISSVYPDAELTVIKKKDYIEVKRPGYVMRSSTVSKTYDKYFPIKTYKYFEEDPLSNLTSNFESFDRDDTALMQFVIKPVGERWNKKAKEVARKFSKGEYKRKGGRGLDVGIIHTLLAPIGWFASRFISNEYSGGTVDQTHPGASGGDAFKIFNQAEQEAQKMVGESAGQQSFEVGITLLVSSNTVQDADVGQDNLIGSTSIYTDEYCNKLDNPQIMEDLFGPIYRVIHYWIFKYKLLSFLSAKSNFSIDELTTMYHFPDVTYNRSPNIQWLEYKKVAPPHNLKSPHEPLMMTDYVRTKDGYIEAKDGTKLKADENGNLFRTEGNDFKDKDDNLIETHKKGKQMGLTKDPQKMPKLHEVHREFGGFPVYKDAVLMGWNEYRNKKTPIYFSNKDRGRHHYVIGKSGGGKSVFIGYLARQDVWAGKGVGVIDPHGDLIEDILAFTPKERAQDMYVFDPADYERPMGLNMLEVFSKDPDLQAIEKDRAALDATSIFIKIFDEEIFGPRIQHYFRNGALTLMDDDDEGGTLIDVPRLFVDDAFMRYKVSKVKNAVVQNFWEYEYSKTGDREKQEMIPYFNAKFGPFITNTTIRNIIGQPKSAFNIREIMDNEKCLMVNLSKGKIGELNAQLLGLIFVSKVNMAAMSRADTPEDDRKPFYFFVDEFQNFATDTFGEILSEARKYRLALIMAHQFIAQIGGNQAPKGGKPSIKDAVFGNAGTIMSFKVGAEDAEYLEKEYAPVLSQQDIIGIANFTTYCKLNISNASTRPFDLKTIWDNHGKNVKAAEIIKEYSRRMYARKKEYVDMEIEARLGIKK